MRLETAFANSLHDVVDLFLCRVSHHFDKHQTLSAG
jgi:hypothetical protein